MIPGYSRFPRAPRWETWTVLVVLLAGSPALAASNGCSPERPDGPFEVVAERTLASSKECYYAGELTRGVELVDATLAEAPPGADPLWRVRLLTRRGQLLATRAFIAREETDQAISSLRRAVDLATRTGAELELANALTQLGFAEYTAIYLDGGGSYTGPAERFAASHALYERLGDRRGLAESGFYLGLMQERGGRVDDALASYHEALEVAESCGCALEASFAHRHIAGVSAERGELDDALRHFERSLELREQIGFRVYLPFSLLSVAQVRGAQGHPELGLPDARRAETMAAELDMPRVVVLCRLTLGDLFLAVGDRAAARDALLRARDLATEIHYDAGVREAGRLLAGSEPGD